MIETISSLNKEKIVKSTWTFSKILARTFAVYFILTALFMTIEYSMERAIPREMLFNFQIVDVQSFGNDIYVVLSRDVKYVIQFSVTAKLYDPAGLVCINSYESRIEPIKDIVAPKISAILPCSTVVNLKNGYYWIEMDYTSIGRFGRSKGQVLVSPKILYESAK